jgi:excisionase family DNA binding protein
VVTLSTAGGPKKSAGAIVASDFATALAFQISDKTPWFKFLVFLCSYNWTVTIMQDNQKLAYTVNSAAAALDISRSKLYELMKHGAVSYVCIGTDRRIPYSEIVRISTKGIADPKASVRLANVVHSTRRHRLKR